MNRQFRGIVLRLVISIGLLALLVAVVDRDALAAAFSQVNLPVYLLGLAAFAGGIWCWTLRWYLFIRAAGETISFGRAFLTLLTGLFYAMFLPAMVGADVGRMYELGRDADNNRSNVVSSVLLDRLFGLIALALTAVLALIVGSQFAADSSVVFLVVGVLVALLVGWIIFFNRRFMEFLFKLFFALPVVKRFEGSIREIYEALYQLHNQPRLLLSAGGAALADSALGSMAAFIGARALGLEISPLYFFIFMPLIWLITAVPISIGGLGLREGAFAFFFTQVGVASGDALAISLVFYSYNAAAGLLGGLVLLRYNLRQTLAAQYGDA